MSNSPISLVEIDASLTSTQRARLEEFCGLLLDWNSRMNLTSARDMDALWFRHIIDSLSLLSWMKPGCEVIDVGSGGGFPALPLALLCPEVRWTLVESTGKKAKFLDTAAEAFGLNNVRVVSARAETLGQDGSFRQRFDVVTARGVARLPVLLEYLVPFAKVDGIVLAMKGARVMDEVEQSIGALHRLGAGMPELHIVVDQAGEEAGILAIPKVGNTPRAYPRAPGIPAQEPLID